MDRLEAELKHLFGADVAEQSKSLNREQILVEADAMPELADKMMRLKGNPASQRQLVQSMTKNRAAALCYWLRVA
ncbi:MAG: hypothetical protein DRI65_08505 [Chloroflexota bacterium]|nr:MAG: hypothetical protein DRI65_08505 [Chloroflexota bacterium]